MSKSFLLTLFIFHSFATFLQAQPPCAFDKKHDLLLKNNPVYARQIEQNNIVIRKYIGAHQGMKPGAARPMAVLTIPV
ncbi:MAG TPA: hypothetical protein VJ111_10620, partial [Chitinophagaceae bacterium]|nr:hypothetical protein [Chitinophagaceae bacterium]